MVLYIILGIESLIVVLGLLYEIFNSYIYNWFRKKFEPTATLAIVKVEPEPAKGQDGKYVPWPPEKIILVNSYDAKYRTCIMGDYLYDYKIGKQNCSVGVPAGYDMRFENGRRVIRVYEGNYKAVPWDQRTWENIPEPTASMVLDKNVAFKTADSIFSGGFDWQKLIVPGAIVIVICVLGYFVWSHFQPVAPVSNNATQNITLQAVK